MKFKFPTSVKILLVCFVFYSMMSCSSKKDVVYFQGAPLTAFAVPSFELRYKPNDLLSISVSALNMEAVRPFNLSTVSYTSVTGKMSGPPVQQSYLISSDGSILFPVIGRLDLANLTRNQAENLLREKLAAYVTNPMVNIRIVNYKVSVLGEVKKPGVFTIENEKISVLEALGLAGDLSIHGQRKNVLLIRDFQGKKHFERLDLTSIDFFTTNNYYLQQNDVLYIAPNKAKVSASRFSPSTGVYISVTSLLITLIAILIN
ncbi:MAG: sugar transporter [Flavobacteriaceae bacterium]|nr:MAG: sugar transporter [Flavobacteriaceae bacterium]